MGYTRQIKENHMDAKFDIPKRTATFTPRPGYPTAKATHYESRTAIGIAYFGSEEDAAEYADQIRLRGATYNGGWFHGTPCGREPSRDFEADGVRYYAVTD